ncbi:hypothetical protein LCGC14_0576480 [marine sediment metagenome]|uniref:Uncharacterized protein n=1 Tax=marine sediment metagenome TaxID=412755 RepID=A0A0F9RMN1_9ZZZZ|nr:MAG: hypothetical protein Lokiarch_02040 [Candidatus Lokiarchaeum sp. GC14_75]
MNLNKTNQTNQTNQKVLIMDEENNFVEEISIDEGWVKFFENLTANIKKFRALIDSHVEYLLISRKK